MERGRVPVEQNESARHVSLIGKGKGKRREKERMPFVMGAKKLNQILSFFNYVHYTKTPKNSKTDRYRDTEKESSKHSYSQ